eukprot:CAMPEP_0113553874 /NCGR_PEP_ID=MMETSP0015_2-20120614/15845_1 /TAXON_ID=2838 /ORGANISM="Odontella" /LENGTH=92 /DNA_ID=CAMNT_0000454971 /DNA_START=1399 /DNA_END=1677 /DNA_ORIENTATION=+ /assembly_acc=CAM_ASM_000160
MDDMGQYDRVPAGTPLAARTCFSNDRVPLTPSPSSPLSGISSPPLNVESETLPLQATAWPPRGSDGPQLTRWQRRVAPPEFRPVGCREQRDF